MEPANDIILHTSKPPHTNIHTYKLPAGRSNVVDAEPLSTRSCAGLVRIDVMYIESDMLPYK